MKKSKATHTPEQILEELRALVTEAESIVGNSVSEATDDVVSSLRERYEAAQERLLDAYATAKNRVTSTAASTDAAIREYPYGSLAVAAGAGLLVGLIVASRNGGSSART